MERPDDSLPETNDHDKVGKLAMDLERVFLQQAGQLRVSINDIMFNRNYMLHFIAAQQLNCEDLKKQIDELKSQVDHMGRVHS
jgi:hypothetical protein